MSFEYDYGKKKYFPNGVCIGKLDRMIKKNDILKSIIDGLTESKDFVTVVANRILTNEEKEELLLIFGGPINNDIVPTKTVELVHMVEDFESNKAFTLLIPIVYPKILSYEKIVGVWVISSINGTNNGSDDFYELRVFNVTENKEVAYNKFNNTEDQICKLEIKNQPTDDSYMELQAKTNGKTKISVKNITLLF